MTKSRTSRATLASVLGGKFSELPLLPGADDEEPPMPADAERERVDANNPEEGLEDEWRESDSDRAKRETSEPVAIVDEALAATEVVEAAATAPAEDDSPSAEVEKDGELVDMVLRRLARRVSVDIG